MSGSKPEDKRKQGCACILLTNLEPDKWVIHISHPDRGWWNGTWRVVDVEKLAVCASTFYPSGWRWQSVLSLRSQSSNMMSACLTVYASPMIELGYAIRSNGPLTQVILDETKAIFCAVAELAV